MSTSKFICSLVEQDNGLFEASEVVGDRPWNHELTPTNSDSISVGVLLSAVHLGKHFSEHAWKVDIMSRGPVVLPAFPRSKASITK